MEPLFILAAAAVTLVWGLAYLRFAGLWGYCIATLLVGTVFGAFFFRIGSVSSDRLLLAASILIALFCRWRGWIRAPGWNRSDLLVLCFLTVMTFGTSFSGSVPGKINPSSKLLFYFLLPAGMYWLSRQIEITPARVRWLFAAFASLGLYLAVTAAAEKFEIYWAVFPSYIKDPVHDEFLGRGRGPLLNPSGNGVLLTMGMMSVLMFFPKAGRWGRLAVIGSTAIYLLGIYATLTRCVWMGGIVALGATVFINIPVRLRWPLALWSSMIVAAILALNMERFSGFKRDKNVSLEDMKQSAELRPMLALVAWRMFQDRPILGCGTGQYMRYAAEYIMDRSSEMPLDKVRPYVQHNIFLSLLTENGLAGLLPYVAMLVLWTWWSWKLWRSKSLPLEYRQFGLMFLGTMVGYLSNGMFQDVLIMPMISMYLFFLGGCVRNLNCQAVQQYARHSVVSPNTQPSTSHRRTSDR